VLVDYDAEKDELTFSEAQPEQPEQPEKPVGETA